MSDLIARLQRLYREADEGELEEVLDLAWRRLEWYEKRADRLAKLEAVVKAVAHVGVDFGHGPYEIQESDIRAARELLAEDEG